MRVGRSAARLRTSCLRRLRRIISSKFPAAQSCEPKEATMTIPMEITILHFSCEISLIQRSSLCLSLSSNFFVSPEFLRGHLIDLPLFSIPIGLEKYAISIPEFFLLFLYSSYPTIQRSPKAGCGQEVGSPQ